MAQSREQRHFDVIESSSSYVHVSHVGIIHSVALIASCTTFSGPDLVHLGHSLHEFVVLAFLVTVPLVLSRGKPSYLIRSWFALTTHFHGAYHVFCRHLFKGMRRCAQLSRYASGSLASDISSLVARRGSTRSQSFLVSLHPAGNIPPSPRPTASLTDSITVMSASCVGSVRSVVSCQRSDKQCSYVLLDLHLT